MMPVRDDVISITRQDGIYIEKEVRPPVQDCLVVCSNFGVVTSKKVLDPGAVSIERPEKIDIDFFDILHKCVERDSNPRSPLKDIAFTAQAVCRYGNRHKNGRSRSFAYGAISNRFTVGPRHLRVYTPLMFGITPGTS